MSKRGLIYILLNPSYTNILKIGKTTRSAEIRADELYWQAKSGIPTKFVIAYDVEVSDCDLVERLVHEQLDRHGRVSEDREFFWVPLKVAIRTIENVISELERQHKIEFTDPMAEIGRPTPKIWWKNLSVVWQQIFRMHLPLAHQPGELDIFAAVHAVIDHCQDDRLRTKVADLIRSKSFARNIGKWYEGLASDQKLFNSYLPYEPTEEQLKELLALSSLHCLDNMTVIDLRPLAHLSQLRELNAANTSISDLSPLAGLVHLEKLNIGHTKADSLRPLEALPALKEIKCYGSEVSQPEADRFAAIRTGCKVEVGSFMKPAPGLISNRKNKERP